VSFADLLEQLSGFLRRHYPIFVFIITCALGLGLLYLFTAPPRYTANAMLMIDSSRVRILQQQREALGDVPLDTAQVETQLEVLKSDNIGLSVIKELHLGDDPEFTGSGGVFGAVIRFLDELFGQPDTGTSEFRRSRRSLDTFLRQRSITRVGRTYVIDIGFTSLVPSHAASIANAIADAYIVDQLEAKYEATRRASVWLQDRIKELRTQASAADLAVLEYKEKNNIVDTGGGPGPNGTGGRLIGDQQVAELSTQLSNARATTAEAKAKLDRTDEMKKDELPDAALADSLHNEVINRLRTQYLDLRSREAIWSARYGANHVAAVNLRTQMVQMRKSMSDEIGRIAESYKSDYEIAKAREEALEKNLASLVSGTQLTNRDRLGLRELESNAQVYHTIYDGFLQRYMEALQQQSFPITEARIISPAAPPTKKSSPQAVLTLAIAMVVGAILSFGMAFWREASDRVFRTARQVENILRVNCLAVLALIKPSVSGVPAGNGGASTVSATSSQKTNNLIDVRDKILRQVVEAPLSSFAEGFRSIKVAADINGAVTEQRVIGVTSTLPHEGKSTVSNNFAQSVAQGGKRVILIDCDLRNPTLSRRLARDAKAGLLEVLAGKIDLSQAVYSDSGTGLAFLPAVLESRLAHTSEILASDAFKRLIAKLRDTYDYVVVDFSPLAPVIDVRATTQIIDSYIYVIEWGKTRMNLVQDQLNRSPELYERLLGVVLNKANVRLLQRHEYYYGKTYHKKYYGAYGYGE
jgi:succinoglycan biosynthesis transport protein ExoP